MRSDGDIMEDLSASAREDGCDGKFSGGGDDVDGRS